MEVRCKGDSILDELKSNFNGLTRQGDFVSESSRERARESEENQRRNEQVLQHVPRYSQSITTIDKVDISDGA